MDNRSEINGKLTQCGLATVMAEESTGALNVCATLFNSFAEEGYRALERLNDMNIRGDQIVHTIAYFSGKHKGLIDAIRMENLSGLVDYLNKIAEDNALWTHLAVERGAVGNRQHI